jgi:hypothetical protein
MKFTTKAICATVALSLLTAGCGDDTSTATDGGPDTMMVVAEVPKTFKQVEHLARPGINEVFLISNAFLAGYNATAPTFAGVPEPVLGMVVAEAKTVMKALYLGACLINGALGLTAATGVKPAGMTCHAVGGALFTTNALDGTTLTAASMTASQAYADAVFGLFIPDVMRVDMSIATSNYENLCGAGTGAPGLCGGRFVRDDIIDTTYDFLLNGAGTPKGTPQVANLVSDGVAFSNLETNNVNNRLVADPTNAAQGHPNVSNVFPYSANPQ